MKIRKVLGSFAWVLLAAASSDGMFNQKENTKVSTSMIQ